MSTLTINPIATDNIINAAEVGTTITGSFTGLIDPPTVSVWVGGFWRTAAVAATNWSYTLIPDDITNLGEGLDFIIVLATDSGSGAAYSMLGITVDTIAPTATAAITAVTDNVGIVTGNLTSGATTDDLTLYLTGTITGTLNAGEGVAVYDGATRLGRAASNGTNWAFTDYTLADGDIPSYTVRIEDIAMNQGPVSAAFSATIRATTASVTNFTDDVLSNPGGGASISIAKGGTSNDTAPQIDGTLSASLVAGESVHVYRSDLTTGFTIDLGAATVGGTTWTMADSGLVNGHKYSYTARVMDSAGITGPADTAYGAISIDTTATLAAPVITTITPDLGQSATDFITSSRSGWAIKGTGTAGATITVSGYNVFAPEVLGTTTVDVTGNWVYNLGSAYRYPYLSGGLLWAQGTYMFTAQQTDLVGNVSAASAPLGMTLDYSGGGFGHAGLTTTTTLTAVADNVGTIQGNLTNGGYTDDTSLVLTGTISAALTGTGLNAQVVGVYDGTTRLGTATMVTATTWTYTDTTLANGDRVSYTARVEDVSGNTAGASTAITTTIDTVVPTTAAVITAGTDNVGLIRGNLVSGTTTDDPLLSLSGTLNIAPGTGEVVAIYNGAAKLGYATVTVTNSYNQWGEMNPPVVTWTYQDTVTRTNGTTLNFTARVEDAAGNQSTASAVFTTTIDIVVPTTTAAVTGVLDNVPLGIGNIASGGATNDPTPDISGTLTASLLSGESVHVFRGGVDIGVAAVAGAATTWTFADTLPTSGSYSYTAQVQNSVGNASAVSAAYSIIADIAGLTPSDNTHTAANVTFTFTRNLTGIAPATTDFVYELNGDTIMLNPTAVGIATNVLTLTLASALTDVVEVTYTPGANPLQDANGNLVGALHLISGGSGANLIDATYTTAGMDVIWGGAGADTIDGGGGDDTIAYSNVAEFIATNAVIDTITGGAGTDKIQIAGAIALATADNLGRVNTVEQLVAAGQSAANLAHNIVINSAANLSGIGAIDLSGDTGATSNAVINLAGVASAMTIRGVNTGANTITGGNGADTISGGNNNDVFNYTTMAGFVAGGAVVDSITGGAGTDKIQVTGAISLSTSDSLARVTGVEQLVAATVTANNAHNIAINTDANLSGITTINLSGNTSTSVSTINLTGVSSSMTIIGTSGTGINNITGGSGADTITGGSGNDTFSYATMIDFVAGGVVVDSITGGLGTDTIRIAGAITLTTADTLATRMTGVEKLVATGPTTAQAYSIAINSNANLSGINTIDLSNDIQKYSTAVIDLTGVSTAMTIYGVNGGFGYWGGFGSFSLTDGGNRSSNTITGGSGADTLYGGNGDDTFAYNSMAAFITGWNPIDTIYGESYWSQSRGLADKIQITGNITLTTSNSLYPVQAVEQLVAAPQSATALTHSLVSSSGVFGGWGSIRSVDLSGDTNAGSTAVIDLTNTGVSVVKGVSAGSNNILGYYGPDSLTGGAGADTITGGATWSGTDKDTITGGGGIDVLDGGLDNDIFFYNSSAEFVTGNAVEDTVTGGDGTDQIQIDGGITLTTADSLARVNTVEQLVAATQSTANLTHSIALNDSLSTAGITTINLSGDTGTFSSAVIDLTGVTIGKTITGVGAASATNNITGGSGNDTINGSAGNETLNGGLGNDSITGGYGVDIIDGGDGNDTFIYASMPEFADIFTSHAVIDSITGGLGTDSIRVAGAITLTTADTLTRVNTVEQLVTASGSTVYAHSIVLNSDASLGSITTFDLSANTAAGSTAVIDLTGVTTDMTLRGLLNASAITTLTGGSGNDTFVYGSAVRFAALGGAVIDSISGGGGTDRILLTGAFSLNASNNFSRMNSVEQLAAATTANNYGHSITLTDANLGGITTIDLSGNTVTASTDTINMGGVTTTAMTLKGTSGTGINNITGGTGADTITGGGGNDTFFFTAMANFINGGVVVDSIDGGAGTDKIAALGVFNLTSLASANLVGVETLAAQSQSVATQAHNIVLNEASRGNFTTIDLSLDTNASSTAVINMSGVSTAMVLRGVGTAVGVGTNTITGGSGMDTITGGGGNDTFIYNSMADFVDTLGSHIMIDSIVGGNGTADKILVGGGAITLTTLDSMARTSTVEQLVAAAGAAPGQNHNIAVGAGMMGSIRTIDLSLDTGAASGVIDVSLAGVTTSTLKGVLNGTNTLIGGTGADTITGGAVNDIITGGAGIDVLDGGTGGDDIFAYTSIAEFIAAGGAVIDSVTGGAGIDKVQVAGNITLTTANSMARVGAYGSGTTEQLVAVTQNAINQTHSIVIDDATNAKLGSILTIDLSGDTGATSAATINLTGATAAMTLKGVNGTTSTNTITGGSGNDTISGGAGIDVLDGGAGTGNDTFVYAAIADLITSNAVEDTISGGADTTGDKIQVGGNISLSTADTLDRVNTVEQLVAASYTTGAGQVHSIVLDTNAKLGSIRTIDLSLDTNAGSAAVIDMTNVTAAMTLKGVAAGTNTLTGGDGNDTITGGAGADSITAGLGNDSLIGGDGNDTFTFVSGTGLTSLDTVDGGAGIDTLVLTGTTPFTASDFNNVSNIEIMTLGSPGTAVSITTVDATVAAGTVMTLDASTSASLYFNGAAETDGAFNITGGLGNDTVIGGLGNDTIAGGLGNDNLNGGGGNDTFTFASVTGLTSLDTVDGGAGIDTVALTGDTAFVAANDFDNVSNIEVITLGNTSTAVTITTVDALVAAGATLTLSNAANNAALTFNGAAELDGAFSITGGTVADTITGGTGADSITGGAGIDILDGGAGNDTFIYATMADFVTLNAVLDTITGGANTTGDKIQVGGNITLSTADSLANVNTVEQLVAAGQSASAQLHNIVFNDASLSTSGITTIDLSPDAHAGSIATINLAAVSANMTITGLLNGANTITGSSGNNSITGGSVNDAFTFVALTGLTSLDTVDGGLGIDTVTLTGDTTFTATDFNNVKNIEVITLGNLTTAVTITTLDTLVAAGAVLTLSNAANSASLTFNGAAETNGAFSITGGAAADTISGGAGNDTITGGDGNNSIAGGLGNDTLTGGINNDTFTFAAGTGLTAADTVDGGTGSDTVALTGTTTAVAATNFDNVSNIEVITLQNTTFGVTITTLDTLVASGATLTLSAITLTSGVLTFNGSAETNGNFIITGGGAADIITGGSGNDTIAGGLGNDIIDGGTGDDSISAGDGNNIITGGLGADNLTGGANSDTFIYNTMTDFYSGGVVDSISGGTAGTDVIRITGDITLTTDDSLTTTRLFSIEQLTAASIGTNTANNIAMLEANLGNITIINLSGNTGATSTAVIDLSGTIATRTITGVTAGANTITGGSGNNSITGGNGNDTLIFAAGTGLLSTDTVNGGLGIDTVALTGNTTVAATDFNTVTNIEVITLQNTNTAVTITVLNTNLVAAGATLTLSNAGNSGALTFNSAVDANSYFNITGGTGADNITCGSLADTFTFVAGTGLTSADTVNGGPGSDTLVLTGNTAITASDFNNVSNIEVITLQNTNTAVTITTANPLVAAVATLTLSNAGNSGALTFNGAAELDGAFNITGGTGADNITGGSGNDTIIGGTGIDTLDGGAGDDTFIYGALADFITLNAVADTITGGAHTAGDKIQITGPITLTTADSLANVNTVEQLVAAAQSASAQLHNIALNDASLSTSGFTTIDLSGDSNAGSTAVVNLTGVTAGMAIKGVLTGTNTLTGGSGNDTFTFVAGTGLTSADIVDGGTGSDTVALTGLTAVAATNFDNVSNIEGITLANITTAVAITTLDGLVAAGATLTLTATSLTTGVLTFNGGAETDGTFSITGGSGADVITGGSGVDTLNGGGGAGANTFIYNLMADFVDTVTGHAVIDSITGGAATTDTIRVGGNISLTTNDTLATRMTGVEQLTAKTDTAVTTNNIAMLEANMGNITTISLAGNTGTTSTAVIDLSGTAGGRTITGVNGTSSANTLIGSSGNDIISGGAGNDSIAGGLGIDSLVGGAGNDIFTFAAGTGLTSADTTVSGGAGIDTVALTGDFAVAATDFNKVNSIEVITLQNDTQNVTITVQTTWFTASSTLTLNASSLTTGMLTFDGTLETLGLFNITGGGAADVITGGVLADTLDGGAGNDTISANNGNNIITGGTGADTLTAGTGNDTIDGGADDDSITGGNGTNLITGGLGIDTLTGGTGIDTFYYATMADFVDTVSGHAVIDSINGGGGTDRIQVAGAITLTTNDTLATRMTGVAQLVAAASASALDHNIVLDTTAKLGSITTIDLSLDAYATSSGLIDLSGITNAMTLKGVGFGTNTIISSAGIYNDSITGGNGDDTITSGLGNDSILGGFGNDTFNFAALTGLTSLDTVDGGLGIDTVALTGDTTFAATDFNNVKNIEVITLGNLTTAVTITTLDTLVAASTVLTLSNAANSAALTFNGVAELDGAFSITGGAAVDTITGGSGNDTLSGGSGNDVLDGGSGNDVVFGGDGNNSFVAGLGNDSLTGGINNDTFTFALITGLTNLDTVNGGAGIDTVVLTGNTAFAAANYFDNVSNIEVITLGNTSTAVTITTVDALVASGGTLTLTNAANSAALTFNGSAELDGTFSITGGTGADVITGGAGNDTINGGTGNNILAGGAGNDTLTGGAVADTLTGGEGADTITGGLLRDVIYLTETTQVSDVVTVAAGDSQSATSFPANQDQIHDFNAVATLNDILDLPSSTIAANGAFDGYNTGIMSHRVTNGIATFDMWTDTNTYAMLNVNWESNTSILQYLAWNIAAGETVAYYVDANDNGNYLNAGDYLRIFQAGPTAAGSASTDDIIVDIYTTTGLGGVTALSLAAAANTVVIV